MPRINKTLVDRTSPGDKSLFVWDDEIKGFGLLVLPSGVKSFVYQYRSPEGRSRRITLGKHSTTFTAEQARTQAKKRRRQVEDGGDPLAERQAARDAITVGDLLDKWTESARFTERSAATQANDRGRVKHHLKPLLGAKFAHQLTAEHVRKAFAAIRDGKTAKAPTKSGKPRGLTIVRGGEGAARMAIRVLRCALNWGVSEGLAPSNPAIGVKLGSDGNRDVVMPDSASYERLFRTLDRMEHERRLRAPVADAIRVLALTGARRGEISGLHWRHVDMQRGVLILPPTAHKAGHRTGKPRTIGLPSAAQAIIARQPDGEPDDLVFQPARGDKPLNLSKPWRAVRTEAELPEGIGLHGLRHSLASMMAAQGAQAAEIMQVLGHRQLSTSQRYVHAFEEAQAALSERAAGTISAALGGKPKAPVVRARTKGGRK